MATSRRSRPTLNASQIALIHLAKKQLGMDDEVYRTMLENVAGVKSSRDLDTEGLEKIMAHLTACGFRKTPGKHEYSGFVAYKRKWEAFSFCRPGMAQPGQLAAIEADWDAMRWYWAPDGFGNRDLALRAFLQRRFHVDELRFLNFSTAAKVIMALKAIQNRRDRNV